MSYRVVRKAEYCIVGKDMLGDLEYFSVFLSRDSNFILELEPHDCNKIQSPEMRIDSTLPLRAADIKITDNEELLKWVSNYGLPLPDSWDQIFILHENQEYLLKNGRRVQRFISLDLCRSFLDDVKAAVQLWEGIVKQDYDLLRKTIKFANGEISLKNKFAHKIYPHRNIKELKNEYSQDYFDENEKFIFISRAVLSQIVNNGLRLFSARQSIELAKEYELSNLLPDKFISSIDADNPMVYIWSTIAKELCGNKKNPWHYIRCVDCRVWVDLNEKHRRRNRKRCDICAEEWRKLQGRERAARQRERDKQKTSEQCKA